MGQPSELFQVCINTTAIKTFFFLKGTYTETELKLETLIMRRILNSHYYYYRKIICIMIYGCSLCFMGRLQKKLRKLIFLSNKQHHYILSLAFHWWLVKSICHYELLSTWSYLSKISNHCPVQTAYTYVISSHSRNPMF